MKKPTSDEHKLSESSFSLNYSFIIGDVSVSLDKYNQVLS